MLHNSIATSCTDIRQRLTTLQLEHLQCISGTDDFGRVAYRELRLAEQLDETGAFLLSMPPRWLSVPWRRLHNGYQYLALQQPLALVLSDLSPRPPLAHGPLRILLTTAASDRQPPDDDLVVAAFAESLNKLAPKREYVIVGVTVERQVSGRRLLEAIRTAQLNGEPFHVWHHVGDVRVDAAGLTLLLADEELKPTALQALMQRLCLDEANGLRLFLLHTTSHDPALLPSLAALPAPATVCLRMGGADSVLLRGFYRRCLTENLATAMFLARLDSYIGSPQDDGWSAIELVNQTQPLRLTADAWQAQWRKPLSRPDPPRFLFLRANPPDVPQGMLSLDREIKSIKAALRQRRGQFAMADEGALERADFSRILHEFHPHLLHFSGHGIEGGSLVWETADGKPAYVEPEQIASMLAQFSEIRCVILNACHSTRLAELLKPREIIVIGMNDSVTDDAAVHFARGLYQALAHGATLARAFELAKAEIVQSGAVGEESIPQISDCQIAERIRFFKPESPNS